MKPSILICFFVVVAYVRVAGQGYQPKSFYTPEDSLWYIARTSGETAAYKQYLQNCPDATYLLLIPDEIEKELLKDTACQRIFSEIHEKFDKVNENSFTTVDQMPEFPGGDEARIKFLVENMKLPEEGKRMKEMPYSGTIYIDFLIGADGVISHVRVLHGIGNGCDEESVHVIKIMPPWIPGRMGGKAVNVQYNIPIKICWD
jgi:hypothetical protein